MKLLVTGGAGFIGSNLIRYVINDPCIAKLVNLDCLTYADVLKVLKMSLPTQSTFSKRWTFATRIGLSKLSNATKLHTSCTWRQKAMSIVQ